MNRLLERQLSRLALDPATPPCPEQWRAFIERVDRSYEAADQNRYLLERSLRISSEEMKAVYEGLRALSENRLAAERDRLRAVIDALSEGLCLLDHDGLVLVANATAGRLLGRELRDLVGSPVLRFFRFACAAESDGIDSAEAVLGMVAGGGLFSDESAQAIGPDGVGTPVACHILPVFLRDQLSGSVLVFRDVSERIRARTQLLESEARYRHLFDHSPVASWELDLSSAAAYLDELIAEGITDLSGHLASRPDRLLQVLNRVRVTMSNAAAVKLFEAHSAEGLVGALNTAVLTPESLDSFLGIVQAVAERRPRISTEISGQTVTGRRLHTILDYAALDTGTGVDFDRVVMTFADITTRKEDEERMEELIRLKDEFLATVSHELRTPLSAVVASAAMLDQASNDLDRNEVAELIGFIRSESDELALIIEDLLVGARADTGNLTVHPEVMDLAGAVDAVIAASERVLGGRRPKVTVGVDRVWADPVRLRQILRNLFTNAGRYGGPEVSIETQAIDGWVAIHVMDDGDGIPESEWERVFEPYSGLGTSRGLPGSVGLGLTVSRQLARLMDGDLVYRHDGAHSVFTLTLPLTETASHRQAAAELRAS